MSKHYFAKDGNYGDADELIVVPTIGWTQDDWERIEDCEDKDRAALATKIYNEVQDRPNKLKRLIEDNAILVDEIKVLKEELSSLRNNPKNESELLLLFAGHKHYAAGGAKDFMRKSYSLDELQRLANELIESDRVEWYQITNISLEVLRSYGEAQC